MEELNKIYLELSQVVTVKTEREMELERELKSMLHLFDRELPGNSIGRMTCDDAWAVLNSTRKG